MTVEIYDHDKHLGKLTEWLASRNISVPDRRLFARFGLVIDDKAIGFLVQTDSAAAWIDHVAADPKAKDSERKQALELLFRLLEQEAFRKGYLMVTALAQLPVMRSKFTMRGYQKAGEYGLYFKTGG